MQRPTRSNLYVVTVDPNGPAWSEEAGDHRLGWAVEAHDPEAGIGKWGARRHSRLLPFDPEGDRWPCRSDQVISVSRVYDARPEPAVRDPEALEDAYRFGGMLILASPEQIIAQIESDGRPVPDLFDGYTVHRVPVFAAGHGQARQEVMGHPAYRERGELIAVQWLQDRRRTVFRAAQNTIRVETVRCDCGRYYAGPTPAQLPDTCGVCDGTAVEDAA